MKFESFLIKSCTYTIFIILIMLTACEVNTGNEDEDSGSHVIESHHAGSYKLVAPDSAKYDWTQRADDGNTAIHSVVTHGLKIGDSVVLIDDYQPRYNKVYRITALSNNKLGSSYAESVFVIPEKRIESSKGRWKKAAFRDISTAVKQMPDSAKYDWSETAGNGKTAIHSVIPHGLK